MSSDSPTGGELSGLLVRLYGVLHKKTEWMRCQNSQGWFWHLTSQEKKRVEGSVLGKYEASIICVWRYNTMPDRLQNGLIGGGYFHLLQAPFGAKVAKKPRPCAPSWSGVVAGAAQVPNWLLPSQKWRRCQCNALMMHRTLNSLINTINYNYF